MSFANIIHSRRRYSEQHEGVKVLLVFVVYKLFSKFCFVVIYVIILHRIVSYLSISYGCYFYGESYLFSLLVFVLVAFWQIYSFQFLLCSIIYVVESLINNGGNSERMKRNNNNNRFPRVGDIYKVNKYAISRRFIVQTRKVYLDTIVYSIHCRKYTNKDLLCENGVINDLWTILL